MNSIQQYVLAFAKKKLPRQKMKERDLLAVDYLQEGLLDSLQFIEMISDMEKTFGVRFSSDQIRGGNLRTFAGLVESITRLLHEKTTS